MPVILSIPLLILVGAIISIVLAPFWFYQPRFLSTLINKLFPDLILDLPNDKHLFAITFDDGPNPPYTDKALTILAQYGAKATFFLMGKQIKKHPEYVNIIKDQGHTIGNHSHSSIPTFMLSKQQMARFLKQAEEVSNIEGSPKFFRPAWALLKPSMFEVADSLGYKVVLGSAYTSDWLGPPQWYMRWAFRRMLHPGTIVVLHDGRGNRQATVDILPYLLEEAQRRGLQAVTLDTLLRVSKKS